ncbi:TPA: hypothetical protein OCE74_004950, partial [Escherichia coli]|nr:hypothetical protein [Escherichia coli]
MILGNDYVDLAPLFQAHSTRNYLLSTLDFTDPVGVSSHKVAVSQLVEWICPYISRHLLSL